MKAVAIIGPKFRAWDPDTGLPLAGGKVYTYWPGTTTNKATYTGEAGDTANANPVILDANGEADIYLDGSYAIKVTDSADVTAYTVDPVSDPSQLGVAWGNQKTATQYSANQFEVTGDKTLLYTLDLRVKLEDLTTLYGTITAVSFTGGNTRVTVDVDGGTALTASLTSVYTSIFTRTGVTNLLGVNNIGGFTVARGIGPADKELSYIRFHTTEGDGGGGLFRGVTGAAPGTYTDDDGKVILPSGGDGSAAYIREPAPFIDVRGFGAKIDGVTDDEPPITAAEAVAEAGIYMPAGSYNYSGTVYALTGPFIWLNDSFSTGVNPASSGRGNLILLTTETSDNPVQDGALSRVGMNVTVNAKGAQHGSGVRANLNNYSTDGNGCTAFYGHANSVSTTNWSTAVHGETRHGGGTSIGVGSESACYSDTGTFYGMVVNNTTATAEATHPLTGLPAVAHSSATGVLIQGANHVDPMGGWIYGIRGGTNSMRDTVGASFIRDDTVCPRGIYFSGLAIHSEADIYFAAPSANGAVFAGTYTGNAIRLNNDLTMAWESTGGVRTRWDTTATRFVWSLTGVDRVRLNLSATPALELNSTQVVTTRRIGWAAASGTATRTTFATSTVTLEQLAERVKALIDDLTTHGLIGV